jgi:hypothetical protein
MLRIHPHGLDDDRQVAVGIDDVHVVPRKM